MAAALRVVVVFLSLTWGMLISSSSRGKVLDLVGASSQSTVACTPGDVLSIFVGRGCGCLHAIISPVSSRGGSLQCLPQVFIHCLQLFSFAFLMQWLFLSSDAQGREDWSEQMCGNLFCSNHTQSLLQSTKIRSRAIPTFYGLSVAEITVAPCSWCWLLQSQLTKVIGLHLRVGKDLSYSCRH